MTNNLDILTASLQNYVVAPLNAYGMGGFVFDVEGESTANLAADITDHYTEDNRALQDHIAIKPKRITLKGYVGELVYNGGGQGNSILQKAVQKLTVISAYLPALSASAQQAEENLAAQNNSPIPLTTESNIYGIVKNAFGIVGDQTGQQSAYAYFQALQTQGILMGIQTPWEFLTNMAIETIVVVQGEDTRYISDFSVSFKQIRIAETLTTAYTSATSGGTPPPGGITLQGAASLQCTPENPLGIVPGLGLPTSALPGAQGLMSGVQDLLNSPLVNIYRGG